ncbi:MAG: TolC family protein, partial [Spirochaetia bacterium]|nr:TolC family protein [Spirochaetia bacterium]
LTKIISSRYGTGSGNLAGITNAKRKTGEYNDRLILLKGEYESARISLEYYLSGKNENFSNGELQKYFSILRKRIPSEDELEGRSLDIAVQKELQKRSQREKNRSRLSFAPDMGIFAGYKKEEMEKGAMSYGYRNQKTYTVGITLKIPLWSSFASVSNYKEKKETLKSSDLALEDIKRRIKYEYRSSDQMLQVHEKRLKLLDSQLIPQANLSLKSSKLSWETKKTDFNALLDAYDSLYRENILRIETESEKNKKIIDLSYLQNSFL